ncbi:MAG: MarR family winged helix-turn-helix transcriptional regulator [Pseudomonadota bacterium]
MKDDLTCLATSLRRAAFRATEIYNHHMAPSGLTVTMFRQLTVIRERPEASITELAAALDLDRSTLGRNLRVLQREGLVTLAGGRDDRSASVALTAEASAAYERALPLWQAAQAEVAARLDGRANWLLALPGALEDRA